MNVNMNCTRNIYLEILSSAVTISKGICSLSVYSSHIIPSINSKKKDAKLKLMVFLQPESTAILSRVSLSFTSEERQIFSTNTPIVVFISAARHLSVLRRVTRDCISILSLHEIS